MATHTSVGLRALALALLITSAALVLVLALAGMRPLPVLAQTTCTVTSLDDAGAGTLRAHIADAGCDVIDFDEVMLPGTIALADTLDIFRNVTIDGPGAGQLTVSGGGAVRVLFIDRAATVTLEGVTITGGSNVEELVIDEFGTILIEGDGGGILNEGTLTVSNSLISGNTAGLSGGGILNHGTLTVSHSTLSGNTAQFGAAIFNGRGSFAVDTLRVTHSTISGNVAEVSGGAIYNFIRDIVEIEHSTFADNVAWGFWGGGIQNDFGVVSVTNSTFSGNEAGRGGGGIRSTGTLTVTSSTFSGNIAGQAGASLHNTRVGTSGTSGVLTARNIIVAGDAASGHCANLGSSPLFSSDGVNLAEDGSCPGFTHVDNLMLAALADNSGPTLTHALLPGSPAIGAVPLGDCTDADGHALAADQRGLSRPQGDACDAGAFELAPPSAPPVIVLQGDSLTIEAEGPLMTVDLTGFVAESHDAAGNPVAVRCGSEDLEIVDLIGTFPVGTTTVTCTAVDDAGNEATASFTVDVTDTTPPELTVPDDIVVETDDLGGAIVSFEATAFDLVDGDVPVVCDPASGSTFALGMTTLVECVAIDEAQNEARADFSVTVLLPAVETIEDLFGLVDTWIERGDLLGRGPGQSGGARLAAWLNTLEAARHALDAGGVSGACHLLAQALGAVDGTGPQQLVTGDAAPPVAVKLSDLAGTLDCP